MGLWGLFLLPAEVRRATSTEKYGYGIRGLGLGVALWIEHEKLARSEPGQIKKESS